MKTTLGSERENKRFEGAPHTTPCNKDPLTPFVEGDLVHHLFSEQVVGLGPVLFHLLKLVGQDGRVVVFVEGVLFLAYVAVLLLVNTVDCFGGRW
jgi:hypothetical protein